MQFYVLSNGEQQGPFTVQQIRGYINMGHFQETDLAWHEGLPEWKPLRDFKEFATRAHRTPNYKGMAIGKGIAGPKRQHKTQKSIAGILVAVIVLAAAGGGGYYYWQLQQKKKAEAAAKAAAEAAQAAAKPSYPNSLDELSRTYPEPAAGQNAAELFEKGFAALEITEADRNSYALPIIGKGALPSPAAALSSSMRTALTEFLGRNSVALDSFRKAAALSNSRYPIDLSKGMETSAAHLPKIRQAAQLAALSAIAKADAQSDSDAAAGIIIALGAGQSLETEPMLLSQLTRAAIEAQAVDALEQVLHRVALSAPSLTQLQAAFSRAADAEAAGQPFTQGLLGERVATLAVFDQAPEKIREQFLAASNIRPGTPAAASADTALANLQDQRKFYEESMNEMLGARKDALPGRLKADELLVTKATDARSRQFLFAASLLAPGRITAREATILARLRLSQLAVALEQFRDANNNKLPNNLTELAPRFINAIPNDPFDGKPLRYRKSGEGYTLYSIGPDAKDNAGAKRADDLSFVLIRPPKPAS